MPLQSIQLHHFQWFHMSVKQVLPRPLQMRCSRPERGHTRSHRWKVPYLGPETWDSVAKYNVFFYIIGHSDHISRLWDWPSSPAGSVSTNSCDKIGFCWSESRALCWYPAANAILLSHLLPRNRWGETAECSSSCSWCPAPHELWCRKGEMKR